MPHKDPEVKRAYLAEYRRRNRAHLLELHRIYNREHRAEERIRWDAWKAAHPEARRAIEKRARQRFEQAHPDRIRDKNAKRRARILAVHVETVDRLVVFARDKGRCGICGRFAARAAFEVDHVRPLSKGGEHSYANVQVAHAPCNKRKSARLNGTQRGMGLAS